jgi:putative ABC transport system permease protein
MIGNYLKIAWRNIANNKLYSTIKIGGFAFSVAICILILLYIKHETSYDRMYPDMDRVFRLVVQAPDGDKSVQYLSFPAPAAKTLQAEIPSIESVGRVLPNTLFGAGSNLFTVNGNAENHLDAGFVYIDQSILEMFPLPIMAGQLNHALDKPNSLVITKSKAQKFFKGNAVGQTIYLNNNKNVLYNITAVIDDVPSNSSLYGYDYFISLAGEPFYRGEQNNWGATNYITYVKLKENTDLVSAQHAISKNYIEDHYIPINKKNGMKISPETMQSKVLLQNALDMHLYSKNILEYAMATQYQGDIKMVWVFAGIAFFILLIACINFVNLSTANAATRAKEIGIRKTIGSSRSTLITQFMVEAVCYSLISLIIGLLMAWTLLPLFNSLANKTLVIPWAALYFMPSLILTMLTIGGIAGIYPALYLSGFQPINALKSKSGSNPKTALLRNGLVVFQFATSIILMISALIANQQISYMLNKDIGFNKDQVIVLRGINSITSEVQNLKNELKAIPAVSNVSIGDYLPVPLDGVKRNGNPFWAKGKEDIELGEAGQFWNIDENYVSTFGLRLIAGRNLNPLIASDSSAAIVNKKMITMLGIKGNPIGAQITNGRTWTIIGVVDDFIFESLKGEGYVPVCMALASSPSLLSIKTKSTDMAKTLADINTVWDKFAPNQKINYSFLDEGFASLYQDVERTKNIFSCFAIVAIFVAALGLFGLATYVTQQRTKEIGVRKVLGASTLRLLKLLSGDFIKLVFVALVIATPVAWWAMNQWLRDFNYKIDINWMYFILAGMGAILIALGTISYQTWKAIRTNPVDSLRDE